MPAFPVEPHVFVILGVTGDLSRRKLLPALHHMMGGQDARARCRVLGVGRGTEMNDSALRVTARQALLDAGVSESELAGWCEDCLHYQALGEGTAEDYRALGQRIESIEAECGFPGNRVFYFALPPAAFPDTINGLGEAGLNRSKGWTRLVIEKPFGHDLASAQALNALVHGHVDEPQVYRIDHYLGKETVQNLLVFRFANPIFESLWNRDRVQCVQITVAEDLALERRARYYDGIGALRDMVQNHLTQLVSLIAMEVPVSFRAEAIRYEKLKVLHSLTPLQPRRSVLGQYAAGRVAGMEVAGYREEPGVDPESRTDTFAALCLEVGTWRWQGVPFYLRTGKRLPRKLTQVDVVFREPPICLFDAFGECRLHSNVLRITLQPDEGFALSFDVKSPGGGVALRTQTLGFDYQEAFGKLPDAYETLLLDVIRGDQTLFVHADEVETSWRFYAPLLEREAEVVPYPAGTWGPEEAGRLLVARGHRWQTG